MSVFTVVWSEIKIFKNKFWAITASSMISPLLYMLAFGWGIGSNVSFEGMNYINYIVSGIIGMTTMNVSYGAVANSLNIARTYDKTFEEFMMSPIKPWEYTMGKIIGGALRGLYSAAIITSFSFLFSNIKITPFFVFSILINCVVFSSLGFIVGMLIDSHTDMNKFNSFIITPMSFLCGTFFPVEKMPVVLRNIVKVLPLSITNNNLRGLNGASVNNLFALIIYFLIFFVLGSYLCNKAE